MGKLKVDPPFPRAPPPPRFQRLDHIYTSPNFSFFLIYLVATFFPSLCVPAGCRQNLVAPHIESYNFFLEDGLAEAVKSMQPQAMEVTGIRPTHLNAPILTHPPTHLP